MPVSVQHRNPIMGSRWFCTAERDNKSDKKNSEKESSNDAGEATPKMAADGEQIEQVKENARKALDGLADGLNRFSAAARTAGESDGRGGASPPKGGNIGPYEILSNVSKRTVDTLKDELIDKNEDVIRSAPYEAPVDRRREALEKKARRVQAEVEANDEAMGVTVHKDSAFAKRFRDLTENSQFLDRVRDLRLKYEESDNILVRGLRVVTDKVEEAWESAFVDEGMREALTEIVRLDPSFDLDAFSLHCERVIFPAVLEAELAGDIAVLKDWCSDRQTAVFENSIAARESEGYKIQFKIQELAIERMHKAVLDDHNNPFLIYLFRVYKVFTIRNKQGEIVEGSEDEVELDMYIVGMRRDSSEIDPQLAWSVHEWGLIPK